MKLRLGIMKNAEIAEWFGITEKHFSKHKTKFVNELKSYAAVETVRGGVKILEIICDEYIKESNAYKQIKDKFDDVWAADGFDTCQHVANQIYESHTVLKKNGTAVSSGTCYEYTLAARKELYGSPRIGGEPGKLGSCEYRWGKVDPETGQLKPLTDAEECTRKRYVEKYFGSAAEKTIEVFEMIENKRLDPSYAWEYFTSIYKPGGGSYREFLNDMREEGIELRHCTQLHRNFPK